MDEEEKIRLVGNFEIEFDTEASMHQFISSVAVIGSIEYKAYKEFYGEEKMFHEISYRGKVDNDR
jgi:hypothetical protein